MVDRSDLVVFCVDHNSGGDYQTMMYAKKANASSINLAEASQGLSYSISKKDEHE